MKPDRVKARNTMMQHMKLKVQHVDYCNKTKEPQDDFLRY
jgi:hypothetical protein